MDANDRQVFRDLLDICQLRGRDSTGAININKDKTYNFFKSLGPPTLMFDRRSYTDNIETGSHAAFIGHCRHKTSGAVSVANAHPFEFEEQGIIGVHNGTLTNYSHLDGYSYSKVDSEVLYEHLSLNGPEETFNQIGGAWACVWWDDKAETLNFIRNDKRPLWFCWSENRRKLFWASSIWMLEAIEYDGRKVRMWRGPQDDYKNKYIELPENTLWSFNLEPNAKKDEPTLKMKPAKVIEPKVFAQGKSEMGNGSLVSLAGGSLNKQPTALEVWNQRTSLSHFWDTKTCQWAEKLSFAEFEKEFAKKSGGSVPNPFQDDGVKQLPLHLRPKPATLALIQGDKTNINNSTSNSSETSKSGWEPEKPTSNTTNGCKPTLSLLPKPSTNCQRTNKNDSGEKLPGLPEKIGGSLSPKISIRDLNGAVFVTDLLTGNEYSEGQVQKYTSGVCSYCDTPIGGLEEIHEFFGENRFICRDCVVSDVRNVA